MKYFLVLVSSILLSVTANAQTKVWTLEQCISYAKENNIKLQQSELNVRSSELNAKESYYSLLPNISANGFGGYSWGQRLDQYNLAFVNQRTTSIQANLSGNLLLFSGLQNISRIKQNKYALESNRLNYEQAINDLSLNIANAFLRLTLAKDRLKIAETQIATTQEQVERTRKIYEVGGTNKGELLNIESQATQEEINLINAQNEFSAARLNLILLLNLEDQDFDIYVPEINIDDNPDELLTLSSQDIYLKALNMHAGIQAQEWAVKSNKSAVNVAKGAWSPSIALSGSIGSGYSSLSQEITDTNITITPNAPIVLPTYGGDSVAIPMQPTINYDFTRKTIPFFNQLPRNRNTQLGITISLPILNGLSNYTNLSRAKINYQNSRLELESQKQNLRNTIQTAHNDAITGYTTYKANKKNAEALAESFKYAQEKFNAGQMNAYDFNQAKNNLNNAEIQSLISKYEYLYRVKILEYYLGKPLKL